ncbi:hydroxyacid dehydrogenase [Lawsonibacter asaccharolyticus]|uniref:hydroxyacid dehydrogenase n=1 Tax=Eubacteriales TaxID=186802 RepID=UPI0023F46579|nr:MULTISPECIES: hydroxyacid dehydrogenase [Eubacteriales]UMM46933.1 hydroxyacid dehydrogenase [Lawsonibacter asaccharolyticus]
MATRVLIPQPILPAGYEYLRKHGYEAVDGRGFTEEDIITDIRDCDALIVRTARITRQIFDAAPKLKILARHGAGYDGVDLAAAREHGVLVCTAGGANAISVAELTIFYMLYCSRNFKKVQNLYLQDYRQAKMGVPKTELEGKTLGLVGLGNIGKLVAQKAALGFDMTVLAYDPFAKGAGLPDYIRMVEDRDEIFKRSDYVSLHVPATTETVHSVSDREFGLMKPTAYLINAARGSIVDEAALYRALQEEKIAGAGLDVLEQEPIDPSNPLVAMDNVLTAPHIGGATKEASSRSSVACAQAIDDFFSGRTPKFVVPELRDLIQK